jgi:hypothetical protein
MKQTIGTWRNSRLPTASEIAEIRPSLQQGAMTGVAAGLVLVLMAWKLAQIWLS